MSTFEKKRLILLCFKFFFPLENERKSGKVFVPSSNNKRRRHSLPRTKYERKGRCTVGRHARVKRPKHLFIRNLSSTSNFLSRLFTESVTTDVWHMKAIGGVGEWLGIGHQIRWGANVELTILGYLSRTGKQSNEDLSHFITQLVAEERDRGFFSLLESTGKGV